MRNTASTTLEFIKKRNINPFPSWLYPVRAFMIWLLVFVSILASSLTFGVLVLFFNETEWNLSERLHTSNARLFIETLPYIWIILALVFILLAYFHFHLTEIGYQFQKRYVFSASILLSLAFGIIFFLTGSSTWIENTVANNVNFYHYVDTKQALWAQPNRGLLAGKIIEVKPDNELIIQDFNNSVWQVHRENAGDGNVTLAAGNTVKFIGERLNDGVFLSREIRPWQTDRLCCQR